MVERECRISIEIGRAFFGFMDNLEEKNQFVFEEIQYPANEVVMKAKKDCFYVMSHLWIIVKTQSYARENGNLLSMIF